MTVPYLFEEDFGGVNGSEHNVEAGGASTSASNSATGLGFMGLTDAWSGQRIGSQSGRAVKISSVRGLRQWRGRMTAPPLSGLKADAGEVAVTVEFYHRRLSVERQHLHLHVPDSRTTTRTPT